MYRKRLDLSHVFCRLITALLLFVLLSLSMPFVSGVSTSVPKNVLVLHADNAYQPANMMMDQNFRAILNSEKAPDVSIYSEYLELVRFNKPEIQKQILDLLQQKYGKMKIDLLIITDDLSWDYVQKNKQLLFKDTPIVFCAITAGKLDINKLDKNVTGNFKKLDINANIDNILKMQPETKEIAIVLGTSQQDLQYLNLAKSVFSKYEGKVKANYIQGYTMEKTLDMVSTLPTTTQVLYISFYCDSDGDTYNPKDVLISLTLKSNRPIYGVSDTYLGTGIIGGNILSFSELSKNAADLALQVLNGKKPEDIKAMVYKNKNYFDWNAIKRWNIDEKKLPLDSVILNKPLTPWDLYRWQIITIFCFFLSALFLIILLMRSLVKNKKIQKDLEESEKQIRTAVEESPIPIMLMTEDGEVIKVSRSWCEKSGYSADEIPTLSQWLWLAHGMQASDIINVISPIFEGNTKNVSGEYNLKTKSGETLDWDFYTSNIGIMKDGRKMAMSVAIDITDRKKRSEEILFMSYHDVLTDLLNRRGFENELYTLDMESKLPLSFIISDINGLKLINDVFGHIAGDNIIKLAVEKMKAVCRPQDVIARWGGDEIVILLPNTTEKEVEELYKIIDKQLYINDVLSASVSIGYATKQTADEKMNDVMKTAEDFMYKRKLLESKSLRSSIVSSIISTLHERYIQTESHSERMKTLCRETGIAVGISDTMLDDLELLAVLHDIGKIAVKDTIINKLTRLSDEEWIEMKRHTEIGYHIAQSTPEFQQIAEYILSHHERWDGSGYPRELKGEEIPLVSRILSVIDAYDAMTNDRPYRKALTKEQTLAELKRCAGTQFDPNIVEIFIGKVINEVT